MRTLFTIHAGEYLTGAFIEKQFPDCRVWIPSKDSGVDLLITNKTHRRSVSLQVKFSTDFALPIIPVVETNGQIVLTWFQFNAKALSASRADFWVLVANSYKRKNPHFLVIPPTRLHEQVIKHHSNADVFNLHFAITSNDQCWEIRGLKKADKRRLLEGTLKVSSRNFTGYLNNWTPLQKITG